MKRALYLLSAAVVGVSAQTATAPPPKGTPVAAPNRSMSGQLAAGGRAAGLPAAAAASTPVWVDSTGKAVGREYIGQLLTTYNNRGLVITVAADLDRTSGTLNSNAAVLDGHGGYVYYPSSDCTGTAYIDTYFMGVQQTGRLYYEPAEGRSYVYISDVQANPAQSSAMNSYSMDGNCFALGYTWHGWAVPIAAVVPAANFASGPMWVK